MAQNTNPSPPISMEQAMAFAESPAGKQLIRLLQKQDPEKIEKIRQLASNSDPAAVKQTLSGLLSDPGIRALMSQFGE